MGKVPAIVRCLSDYDVWNKESELGWDTVVAVQYALRSKIGLVSINPIFFVVCEVGM